MDFLRFIDRGIALQSARQAPTILLTTTASVIAEMMGIAEDEVPREAETNAALENVGDGVFRVWSDGLERG